MKLAELFETVTSSSVTSVENIGKVEFAATPSMIRLYKRDANNCPRCVAQVRRYKNQGWKFITNKDWKEMKLPHFGYLENAKLPMNGKKTISGNLKNLFKAWGITHEDITMLEK